MAGIGDLVAHLSVDNKGWSSGLNSAKSSMSSFTGSIGSMVAPIAGLLGGIWGTSAAIGGYKTALENQRKFQAVLEATGGAAGITAQEMADYAGELQGVTNFEDDATMGAAALMASFGNINGDNFKRSISLAQDMATVMGTDLDSAVKKMGKSLAGLSTDEVSAKLDEMQARFGGAALAVADPWVQLQNTLGDVGEGIGSVLLPSINVLSESLTSMLGVVAGGGEWFKSMGIEAAVVLSHMGGLLTLGVTQWELFGVQVIASAAHLFTTALPTYLTWFGDNWGKVLFTAVDYAATLFINLGTNIRNMWSAVVSFLSGNGFTFDWTPMTEGFKSAIDKLPDVPERVTSDFEKSLKDQIDGMSTDLGTSMDTQRAELEKQFSPLAKPMPTATEAEAVASDTKATSSGKGPSALKAAFQGSSEAASIMLRGVGGGKSIEDIAGKQLTVAQQQLDATKANKPQPMTAVDFGV
jgi:hypothetical protein